LSHPVQPNPGNPVPTTGYPVLKPDNKLTHYPRLIDLLPGLGTGYPIVGTGSPGFGCK